MMRTFLLVRNEDVSGVSGVGVVAEGVQFSDGAVAVKWIAGQHRSTVLWDNINAVRAVNGHDGRTEVRWIES